MPGRPNSHVIQSGPNKGLTVGQVKARKRASKSGAATVDAPQGSKQQRKQLTRLDRLERKLAKLGVTETQRLGGKYLLPKKLLGKDALAFYEQFPGLTEAGRHFLVALTHPNNETGCAFVGIPDALPDELNPFVFQNDVLSLSYTDFSFTETFTAPPEFTLLLLFPPIPEIECVALAYASVGATTHRSRARVFRKPGVDVATTVDVGTNKVNQFPTLGSLGYDTARCAGSGRTLIPICSDLNNAGNMVWGQLPGIIHTEMVTPVPYVDTDNVATQFQDYLQQDVHIYTMEVPDLTQLKQIDKKSADGQFKDGAYIVHVPSENLMNLPRRITHMNEIFSVPVHKSGSATPAGNVPITESLFTLSDSTTEQLIHIDSRDNFGQTNTAFTNMNQAQNLPSVINSVPNVSQPCDMLTGFAVIKGLNTGIAGVATPAGVNIRTKDYYELYPHSYSSSVATYRQQHALYDYGALLLASAIAQRMPHALPGSDNAFSGVLGKIWDVIKGIGGPLTTILGFIPQTRGIGAAMNMGLQTVDTISKSIDM